MSLPEKLPRALRIVGPPMTTQGEQGRTPSFAGQSLKCRWLTPALSAIDPGAVDQRPASCYLPSPDAWQAWGPPSAVEQRQT